MEKFENIQHNPDMIVLTNCVFQVIAKLECGKAAGSDGICAEYLKFSHTKLQTLLTLCFSLCISHGYLPADLMKSYLCCRFYDCHACNKSFSSAFNMKCHFISKHTDTTFR